MREVILITSLLVLFYLSPQESIAQDNTNAIASITYEFIHVNDTNNRENPRKEEMITYLGRYSSVYNSLDQAKRKEEMYKKLRLTNPTGTIVVGSPIEDLYLLPNEKYWARTGSLGTANYLIESTIDAIDWQIGEDTKEISGYSCQMAKGVYGGREYTVWFAAELPFSFGPWKLFGLPGLILQAEDSRQEVFFNFVAFNKVTEEEVSVVPPKKLIKTTEKEFAKAKVAHDANPFASMTAGRGEIKIRMGGQDGTSREVSMDEYKEMNKKRMLEIAAKNNNPLELEKN